MYESPDSVNSRICVKNDELVFPLLLLYPESNTSDYVREMSESDTFADIFYVLVCWLWWVEVDVVSFEG